MSTPAAQELTDEGPPREVCGYAFVHWLKEGRTALCRSEQGRLLVVKCVEEDCLLDGNLHPDIKERLARIRELPHRAVATLIGVERDEQRRVHAIWEYVEGTSFHAWACDPMRDERHVARLLRELVIAVEAMHGQGITHGALHDGNIVIDPQGNVRLLDVSPLLFKSEEGEDVTAISKLMKSIVACRCDGEKAAQNTMLAQISASGDLRQLSSTISRAIQACDQEPQPSLAAADLADERTRKLTMRWAVTCALVAALGGALVWLSLRDTGKAPPQATSEALEARTER